MADAADVTALLVAWTNGDEAARDRLFEAVYDELRRLARGRLRRERPDLSLAPTVLVHEAYLKLIDQRRVQWQNRSHFYSIAGHVMRRILVDHARARAAAKRGDHARIPLDDVDVGIAPRDVDVLALDAALDKLASVDRRQSALVELRFFAGLTVEEAAAALDVAPITVKRDWALARAWLFRELQGQRLMRVSSSWERIRALFHAALEQPADARAAFLSSACEGDESLRREVESLLGAHRASDGFLESPAVDLDADGVAARSQLEAGDRFGNFEVIGSLGAGGMGEVYRARDAQLRREVAIKLLPRALADDPRRLARFERESRILAALNHPHIATIHSIEHADGRARARNGAGRGANPRGSFETRRPGVARRARARARARRRAGGRARQRGRAPGSQAGQHQVQFVGDAEAARLRAREGTRRPRSRRGVI